MRIIYILIAVLFSSNTFARSIFEGRSGECGISSYNLRQGDITAEQIPCIIVNVINNLLAFVGYISLGIIVVGGLLYTFGGVNEEWKSKGKESVKMALFGAVISWSAWIVVNFWLDNI